MRILPVVLGALLTACGTSSGDAPADTGGAGDAGFDASADGAGDGETAAGCTLTANTSTQPREHDGCAVLTRNTHDCNDARVAAGFAGAWLEFSCRVTLTKTTGGVVVASDSQPDYASNFFAKGDPCWTDYTPAFPDPNLIAAQSVQIVVPDTPSGGVHAMDLGAVGIAINGVEIFDNQAAPGDDIFTEAKSFDECQGHPAPGGVYHYHTEPYSIGYDDFYLVGVLRDGYFLYGRRDVDLSTPTDLDAAGGHTGTTPHSTTPIYHHHIVAQTSTSPGTAGETQYFLTTGQYAATPGACTGCR